jgi:DNA-binding NarL/FixJ family response regulator
MSVVRVVVADDQELVRAGFAAIVQAAEGLTVVGTASRGDDAVRVVVRTRPDVVLMDVRMPGLDGIEAVRRIASDPELASVRVIMLTTFGLDEYVFGALRAGARGFLVKDTAPADLLDAVRRVAAGAVVLGEGIVGRVVDELVRTSPDAPRTPPPALTARERDVLALVCRGLTNRQIARRLEVGEATVKTYVSRLLLAFDAESRVMLAVRAVTTGVVRPGDRERG